MGWPFEPVAKPKLLREFPGSLRLESGGSCGQHQRGGVDWLF